MAEISVIIVNYEAADLSIKAVESVLARNHGGRIVDVHLVDNASPSGDASVLSAAAKGWGARVTLYLEETNHGFGRGNNLVLDALATQADPPTKVFMLNPDAALENEAVEILAAYLDTHPDTACAGARIISPDGTPAASAFRFPGLMSEFSAAVNFGPLARLTRRWQVPKLGHVATGPTDWVSGAAMMFRFDALREVGQFDPDFFLYYEEVDLMHRLRRAGWLTAHVAEALVIHVEGASTDIKSGRQERRARPAYWYASWGMYFAKNHGRSYALAAAMGWILGAAMNHLISALRRREPAAPKHFFRDFLRSGVQPLLRRERPDG